MESTEKKPCCCCSTEEPAADAVSPADVPDAVPSCCRHKDRSPEEYKALVNRLSRIEGQVRGVRGMLERTPTVWIFWYRCSGELGAEQLFQGAAGPAHEHLCGR